MIKNFYLMVILCLFFSKLPSQGHSNLIPTNTATHTAVQNGSWFNASTWNTNTVPDNAAIVVIPQNITVTYQGQSSAHIFAIRVDGDFICTQSNTNQTTTLTVDTFIGTSTSYVKFLANNASDGKIDINISPFDIEAHKEGSSGFSQVWNSNATNHFSDGAITYKIVQNVTGSGRYNTYSQAIAGDTAVEEQSREIYDDGVGVTGRYQWDDSQLSLGVIAMGQIEIIGQEKQNMAKLASDVSRFQNTLELETIPQGWKPNDSLVVTRSGIYSDYSSKLDVAAIQSVSGSIITLKNGIANSHIGKTYGDYSFHCYVGNLTRNITFKSSSTSNIHHRGHLMAMHNNTNVQIRNAAFIKMGRTDKSRITDDFIWNNWVEPKVFKSKISALGQECAALIKNPPQDITNIRGRYSIHLHKTGAKYGDKMTHVTGNVVWGNPGWGITHHDSHATISNNVVFDVTGAGIVSETGSETGFWDNNLVCEISAGHSKDGYAASLFHDDYLYSGAGLGMKGRAVICRGNVINNVANGIQVANLNSSVSSNLDRLDPLALANRPGYEVDNFPLSINGYSSEGDGVMPVEAALVLENNTISHCLHGLASIERDMGVNHESRSIIDGLYIWGVRRIGIDIVYQVDYTFNDVFISGYDNTVDGVSIFKHSHNHVFNKIKLVDISNAFITSKLVAGDKRTRNNDFTPWHFIDLEISMANINPTKLYTLEYEGTSDPSYIYDQHSDNTIHLSSSDIVSRPTTFTVLDSTNLVVDYASNNFRFKVDGIITDDLGSYKMGIEQAPAQGTLRLDYPERIYEFASQAKFEEYLSNNGVYKDENDQLYFILNESLPNRLTNKYTTFPVRVKIMNAPSGGVFSNPMIETETDLEPKLQIVSRFATVSQSSTDTSLTYRTANIDASAIKAVDGNNNGRINANFHQKGLVPVGSISSTNIENEPWYDLDLGEVKEIQYIDIWNTVELNGTDLETFSTHFKDFYVLISNEPFTGSNLETSRTIADYEYLKNSIPERKFSLNNLNAIGRYVRIQAIGNNKIKLAEVEIIGKKHIEQTLSIEEEEIHVDIFPNPTDDKLNIKLGKQFNIVSVKVVNILGQVIQSTTYNSTSDIELSLKNTQSGIYILNIKADETLNVSKKIIVQ